MNSVPARWTAMTGLSFGELRARAAAAEAIALDEGTVGTWTVPGTQHHGWADGGGQETHWFFHPDGTVLLTTYDHECALNLYPDDDYDLQRSLLDGVPPELTAPLLDPPGDCPILTIDGDDGHAVATVGGVFWFDGERWRIADGVIAFCAARDLDVFTESGFEYCVKDCGFD